MCQGEGGGGTSPMAPWRQGQPHPPVRGGLGAWGCPPHSVPCREGLRQAQGEVRAGMCDSIGPGGRGGRGGHGGARTRVCPPAACTPCHGGAGTRMAPPCRAALAHLGLHTNVRAAACACTPVRESERALGDGSARGGPSASHHPAGDPRGPPGLCHRRLWPCAPRARFAPAPSPAPEAAECSHRQRWPGQEQAGEEEEEAEEEEEEAGAEEEEGARPPGSAASPACQRAWSPRVPSAPKRGHSG